MAEWKSLIEMSKGRCREFLREPSSFLFVTLMPILFMTILGYAFDGARPQHYAIGWLSDKPADEVPELARMHSTFRADERFHVVEGDAKSLETLYRRGTILLIVEPNPADTSRLAVSFDPAQKDAVVAQQLVADLAQRSFGRIDPLQIETRTVDIPGHRYVDFLIPGLLAMSIMTSSVFGTAMVIVVNRREGLLKRYLVTPMRPLIYILSHVVGRTFMLAVEASALLVAAWLIFRFSSVGSLFTLASFALLGAATFTALAILLASRGTNAGAVNGLANLLSVPLLIASGAWFARDNFPEWISQFARWLPLTPLVDGLRRIALEGASWAELGYEGALLGAYFVVFALAARLAFRWI